MAVGVRELSGLVDTFQVLFFRSVIGLVGVVVIVQPSSGVISHSSLIVLGAAICYAVAHSSTKSLAATEHPLTILFYMCLVQLPIGLCFSLLSWQNPTGIQWFWIAVIGISALTAHFCMAKAMQTAEATVVVTMDFLRLPAIAMVGVAFYAEPLEAALMVGALLMLLGNLLNMYVPENKQGDVVTMMGLGTAGVQMGTSYLLCDESKAGPVHRDALKSQETSTALTNLFSGRPARGLSNRLMKDLNNISSDAPDFPYASIALGPLRTRAESKGLPDFTPLWSGENRSGCREVSAGQLTHCLWP